MDSDSNRFLVVVVIALGMLIIALMVLVLHPERYLEKLNKLSPENDERIQACYHGPCTTYIYLEQQVGCYEGCKQYYYLVGGRNDSQIRWTSLKDQLNECYDGCVSEYENNFEDYK